MENYDYNPLLKLNAKIKRVRIQPNIWRVDTRVGNMQQAIVDRVRPTIQKIFQPRPGMQEKLKLAFQLTLGNIIPVGMGGPRPQQNIWRQFSFGINKFILEQQRRNSQ